MPLPSWNTATAGWIRPSVAAFLLLEDQPINDLLSDFAIVPVTQVGIEYSLTGSIPDFELLGEPPGYSVAAGPPNYEVEADQP